VEITRITEIAGIVGILGTAGILGITEIPGTAGILGTVGIAGIDEEANTPESGSSCRFSKRKSLVMRENGAGFCHPRPPRVIEQSTIGVLEKKISGKFWKI
jgi:hypothetical protein